MNNNSDQDTLIQLHQQNMARQKTIEEYNQKIEKIIELTHILTTKVLPKYKANEVPKSEIMNFVSVLHKTIIDKEGI